VWSVFGVGHAIIAGDALENLAQRVLLDLGTPQAIRAAETLAEATARMIAGQAADLAFESSLDVTFEDCLAMEADKTGALLSCACSIGAILAGAPDRTVGSLAAFGLHLGLAYQAIDDLLGIWGRPHVTGKPVASDIRQRKKSLPVVAVLDSGTDGGRRLASLLSIGVLTDDLVAEATSLIEGAGGRDRALCEAELNIRLAEEALEQASVPDPVRARFADLAEFVTARDL
jgi:geranylgeranyl diphosphate synthase type I